VPAAGTHGRSTYNAGAVSAQQSARSHIGLGNRKGTNAMIRSERFIGGIAIVSIIASLGYIALTLIG
jgi:hypothetical protein